MNIDKYCQDIPKAELHIHIEGSLEPELVFQLAKKNGIALKYSSVAELRQAYQFSNLQSFLDIYYQGASVLLSEEDFYELMLAYLQKANLDNIKRAEIFFDPQIHTSRGVAFETVVKGLHKAICEMEEKTGISCILIMCFLRHLGGDAALKTMKQALPYKRYFSGVGLDSSELGFEPALFTAAYDLAREHGFHLVAHAGEEGPPCYIKQAVELLKVERIDHGVRITEDEELLQRAIERQIPLTMCPLSNLKLRVVSDLKEHPLKKLLDKGLCVTINSDDPAYFGGYLAEHYLQTARVLALSRQDIYQLAKNSFDAAFLSDKQRQGYNQLLKQFDNRFSD